MSTAEQDLPTPPKTYGDPENKSGILLAGLDENASPEQKKDADQKAAARAMKLFQSQEPLTKPLLEQFKINEWCRRGVTGAKMIQDPANGQWRARAPFRMTTNAELPNKAATLCEKVTGVLTADPPVAEAVPGEGQGDDPSAAEFATRALTVIDADLDRIEKLTMAIDQAHTYATTFERFWYNAQTGNRVPVEIEAGFDPETGEEAQSVHDAEFRQGFDEFTGEPLPPMPWPDRKKRMVREDGALTDQKPEAATRWVGAIESEILRANNVRLYPHTSRSIKEAYGVGILAFVAWGQLKGQFRDELANLTPEEKTRLFQWRPDWTESCLPPGTDKKQLERAGPDSNEDERLVPVLTTYFDGNRHPGEYPRGVYQVQIADSVILHRSTWEYKDHEGVLQPRMIPLMEILGPVNEIRAAQIGSLLDYLQRIDSVKTLIPATSIIDPHEYGDRTKRYITYNADGGKPETESLPPYPAPAQGMFETMTAEADSASMLEESGQGMEVSNVTSGTQAMQTLSQIHAAMSGQARAVTEFFLRGSEIELEIVRAHFTKPRQIEWTGEDGRYKQQAWTNSEIGTTTDVRLKAGSMTMMQPAQKAMLAREYLQMGLIPPDDFKVISSQNIGGTLALQDDPFRQRIRRQVEDFKAGPPEGWQPPMVQQPVPGPDGMPQMQPAMDEHGPIEDPAQPGAPLMEPVTQGVPGIDPMWAPVPADTLPPVAEQRLRELAKLTSSTVYEKLRQQAPEWAAQVDMEFARMQQAAQPPMPMAPPQIKGGPSTPEPVPGQAPQPTPFRVAA
jgi:hypothetical protein